MLLPLCWLPSYTISCHSFISAWNRFSKSWIYFLFWKCVPLMVRSVGSGRRQKNCKTVHCSLFLPLCYIMFSTVEKGKQTEPKSVWPFLTYVKRNRMVSSQVERKERTSSLTSGSAFSPCFFCNYIFILSYWDSLRSSVDYLVFFFSYFNWIIFTVF